MIKLQTTYKKILADTITPVSIFLKLRDRFPGTILLESSEYHTRSDSRSYICFSPIIDFRVIDNMIHYTALGKKKVDSVNDTAVIPNFQNILSSIHPEPIDIDIPYNGFFGYSNYESVTYFEDIPLDNPLTRIKDIPEMVYRFYQFVIVFDHYKNELYIIKYAHPDIPNDLSLDYISHFISSAQSSRFSFAKKNEEFSNIETDDFKEYVKKAKYHCARGDVFQLVLSRRFSQAFTGDEFNVYRALRRINPSPYMFYFDYGDYKLFGSSPEAQLIVKDGQAQINPIAGTYKRTGDRMTDLALAEQLKKDPKENAEHVMLVDLARNDLSKHGDHVTVNTYGEIQMYSHVIHLVSQVSASVDKNSLAIYGDTFPAGTLSGAPKYRAMQLINEYENEKRSFYGGALGMFGLDGSINHAIMIRTFLSKNNILTYQAGAGLVIDSDPEKESLEVDNKLKALRTALDDAELI